MNQFSRMKSVASFKHSNTPDFSNTFQFNFQTKGKNQPNREILQRENLSDLLYLLILSNFDETEFF